MKVVNIPNYGPVSFPDNMGDDEIRRRAADLANAALARSQYTPDYREQGLGALAASGFRRSLRGLQSTVTDLIPALAGSALGFDEYAKEQLAEAAEKKRQSEIQDPTGYRSFRDVRGFGDAAGFAAETIGELGPDILGILTGAGAGATIGKRVATAGAERLAAERAAEFAAKRGLTGEAADAAAVRMSERLGAVAGRQGAERGSLAGLYGSSVGLNAPDTFENIYEKTGSLEPGIALAFGAAQGVLDTYLPAKILSQLSPAARARVAGEIINRSTVVPTSVKAAVAKQLATTTAGEGLTEGVQEVLGILAEKTAGAKGSLLDTENIDRVLNSAIKGAIGGAAFGAPGAVAEGRREAALSREEAERRAAEAPPAAPGTPAAPIDFNRPAFLRRTGGPQGDLFPAELAQARFTMDGVAKVTPDGKGSSYTEALDAARTKLSRNQELTRDELQMLSDAGDVDSVKMAQARIATEEAGPSTIDERQMSLPGMGAMQRPDRRAAAEEGFLSQEPDLLGDMVPQRQAAPEAVDPLTQRVSDLTQEFIDAGWPPKQAVIKAYEQARREMQDDTLADLQAEPGDTRQGVLQFAPPAPEGRGFREEPFNTQMADQLAGVSAQQQRAEAQARAEQEAAAQREAEIRQAENQRQLQIAEEAEREPAPPAAPSPAPTPTQLTLPGVGVRYADKVRARREAPAEATSAPVAQTVTNEMLTGFGVLPAAPIRKRIVGKDLSNPTERAQVQRELTAYSKNEAVPAASREQVTQFLQSPVFYEQTAMFGPKGGATAAATGRETPRAELKAQPVEPLKPVSATTGKGVQVPSRPAGAQAAAGTRAPRDGRVDVPASSTGQAGVRKESGVGALKAQKVTPIKFETAPVGKAEAKPEAKAEEKPTVPKEAKPTPKAEPKPKAVEKPVEKKAETKPEVKKEAAPKAEKPVEKKAEAKPEPEAKTKEEAAEKKGTALMKEVANRGYAADKTDLGVNDITKIGVIKQFTGKLKEGASAARTYFSKTPRMVDGLRNMAFDLVEKTPRFRRTAGESKAEGNFFAGMDYKSAQQAEAWVRENLSPDAIAQLDKMIAEYQKMKDDGAKALAKHNAEQNFIRTYIDPESGAMELNEVDAMAMPLHPAIADALARGDIQTALRLTQQYFDGTVSRVAGIFLRAGITPKVVLKEGLTNESGQPVPGLYDPKTDTVYLDPVTGMNTHTLLHEVGHAGMAYTLKNPSHPMTKQLQQLFNDVKDSLDTAYGATTLDEFASEAWSNETFRAKLAAINPKGEKITALQRFLNIVGNFFRKLLGRETKRIETALDMADRVIESIISPNPGMSDAPTLYAATVDPKSPVVERWLNSAADVVEKLPYMNAERADKFHEILRNVIPGAGRNLILSTLPLHALSDVAKKYLPSAMKVNRMVEEKGGDEYNRNQKFEPVIREGEKFAKDNPKLVDAFNEVVYASTINEVDPDVPRETYEKSFLVLKRPNGKDIRMSFDTAEQRDTELKRLNDAATAEHKDRGGKDKFAVAFKDGTGSPEKLAQWVAMQNDWEKIGPAGRQLYRRMRDTYKAMYDEIREAIGARIDATAMNDTEKAAVKREVLARLAERGQITPYFPLTRNGDYWLSYTAPGRGGKPDTYVSAFESERERERFVEMLEKQEGVDVNSINRFSQLSKMDYKDVAPNSFVNGVLKIMDVNKVDADAKEQVLRLFLSTLPETSFAQAFQKRQNRLGYKRDAIRALREKAFSMSRQLSNMKYAAKLTDLRDELRQEADAAGRGEGAKDNKLQKAYLNELEERIQFAISPTTNKATQLATSIGFNWLLGFNVSSAVVNLTQVPLIVLPYLGGKYGLNESMKAIQQAYKVYARSGFERSVTILPKEGGEDVKVTEQAMPALDNFDFEALEAKDPKKYADILRLRTLAEEASKAGQLNRSTFYDVLEVDGGKSPMKVFNAASGFLFHHGERMNRQVSMIAAYNLELDRLNKKGAKLEDGRLASELSAKEKEVYAANQAIYATEMTNGGTAAASAPRIAQGAIGKVLFMFKRYGVSMYYLLFKSAREMLQSQDPEVRKQAMKQLAGIYGTAAIFAGLQGLPLFGVLSMIYNMFADDDEEDFATVVRAGTNELAYKGLVNYLTNLDIAARVGLGDLIFRENQMSSGSASMADTVAELLGGPVYGIASKIQRGVNMIGDGEVARGVETMVPTALGNVLRSVRFGTEGANTLRGDPIVGDIGPWNSFAQMFGFAPADYTKQLEMNAKLKGIDKAANEDKTKLLRQYYTATRAFDFDRQMELRDKLERLYSKHPGLGNVQESIAKSMAQHQETTQKMYHGITLSPRMESELRELASKLEG